MVSKIVALAPMALLASAINAYYWHAEISYKAAESGYIQYKFHPVDIQVPDNDALVQEGLMLYPGPGLTLSYEKYGYGEFMVVRKAGPELDHLLVTDAPPGGDTIPCQKVDEYQQPGSSAIIRKAYICNNPVYFGRKGIQVIPTTIPTLPPQPITTTVPATTVIFPTPTPKCLAGFKSKKNGKGPNGACCSHSDDCKNVCIKGVCGVRH